MASHRTSRVTCKVFGEQPQPQPHTHSHTPHLPSLSSLPPTPLPFNHHHVHRPGPWSQSTRAPHRSPAPAAAPKPRPLRLRFGPRPVFQALELVQPNGLQGTGSLTRKHLSIATCKWWFPFMLVEEAMFQMGKMCLLRSPEEATGFYWGFLGFPFP